MIRGYFSTTGGRRRPFVKAILQFPSLGDRSLEAELLVDTGADRTVLAPLDTLRLTRAFRLDLRTLAPGSPSTGVGGQAPTRTIDAVLILDAVATQVPLTILDPPSGPISSIPSLLGRDILAQFASRGAHQPGAAARSE